MIEFKSVNKIFNLGQKSEFYALHDISFYINSGETVLLKGASGSGKSTILSLLAGLSKPTNGEVVVNNKRISKLPDNFTSLFRRQEIGFIFQKFNLIPTLSVKENIILPLIPANVCEKELEKSANALMAKFDISEKKEVHVKNLSGGEQQRVAICRALINNPSIIIADEPTANLDEKLSVEFVNIMKELKHEGKTLIISTHDSLFFNLDFIDKTIELHKGKII